MAKLKRGQINDDGEIEDVVVDSKFNDGHDAIIGIFKFVILCVALVSIVILLAFTVSSNTDKSPNPFYMLRGCFSLIHDKTTDGIDESKNAYYLSSTVRSVYSDCISKTELQPYNKETNQTLSVEVIAAYAVGCAGSKLEIWHLEDKYRLDELATCMKNNNIGWRQIEVTAESKANENNGGNNG